MEKFQIVGKSSMENAQAQVTQVVNIDRPDIVKKHGSSHITFKEIKDALFKFLMQAEIKFISFEKLDLPIEFKSKLDGSMITANNIIYYIVTCRLLDIYVDGKPVYIVTLPTSELELDKRQRGKLAYLKKLYKIVIFDDADCSKLGINLSEDAWLRSLNKAVLKKWAKLLFTKISALGIDVDSKYNLNSIYKKLDTIVGRHGEGISSMTSFNREGLRLKYQIIKNKLEYTFPNLKIYPEPALRYLANIDKSSSGWLEEIFTYTLRDIVSRIDLRKNKYKDFFRTKIGTYDIANKERICALISQELKTKFKLDITSLGYGALRIQDKKTFQTVILSLDATTSDSARGITFSKNFLSKITTNTFHCLNLTFNKKSGILKRSRDIYLHQIRQSLMSIGTVDFRYSTLLN